MKKRRLEAWPGDWRFGDVVAVAQQAVAYVNDRHPTMKSYNQLRASVERLEKRRGKVK